VGNEEEEYDNGDDDEEEDDDEEDEAKEEEDEYRETLRVRVYWYRARAQGLPADSWRMRTMMMPSRVRV
jgi:hypothetical protein